MNKTAADETKRDERGEIATKRPYSKPNLINFGSVSALTKTGGATLVDEDVCQKVGA